MLRENVINSTAGPIDQKLEKMRGIGNVKVEPAVNA